MVVGSLEINFFHPAANMSFPLVVGDTLSLSKMSKRKTKENIPSKWATSRQVPRLK